MLKSPGRFLPGSRLTQVMLLQGMMATAAWLQTSRLVRTVGRSLMLSPLAFRNRMTVKIPPSLLDEAFTDRLDGLDIDSNEGRRALFMVIPRKHPLVAFLQQKKVAGLEVFFNIIKFCCFHINLIIYRNQKFGGLIPPSWSEDPETFAWNLNC